MVVNLGVDCASIDSAVPNPRQKDDPFTFIYGGRPALSKGIDLALELADTMYRTGKKIAFNAYFVLDRSLVGGKLKAWKDKYPFLQIFENCSQPEFWSACKAADVFLCASGDENYGLSFLECLRCGVPVIFFDRPWIYGILPDDYPYIVQSRWEASALLHRMYDDRKYAEGTVRGAQRFIETEHNRFIHSQRVLDSCIALSSALRTKKHPRSWDDVFKSPA
jgi:glycosyltransferase involved in cell wall biosynthesis